MNKFENGRSAIEKLVFGMTLALAAGPNVYAGDDADYPTAFLSQPPASASYFSPEQRIVTQVGDISAYPGPSDGPDSGGTRVARTATTTGPGDEGK